MGSSRTVNLSLALHLFEIESEKLLSSLAMSRIDSNAEFSNSFGLLLKASIFDMRVCLLDAGLPRYLASIRLLLSNRDNLFFALPR